MRALYMFFILIVLFKGVAEQKFTPLSNASKQEVTHALKENLQRNYIFTEYISQIKKQLDVYAASADFRTVNEPENFADALTATLRETVADNHLGVKFVRDDNIEERMPRQELERMNAALRRRSHERGDGEIDDAPIGFKVLQGNIMYLRLDVFDDQSIFYDKIDEAFAKVEKCKAIIIDLRNCRGGAPKAENYVISYFLQADTPLSSIYKRDGKNIIEEKFFASPNVKGSKVLHIPVFILTGNNTFSAAENFAYDLQALKRATIVGVATKGGANPGREFDLGHNFKAFIPTGRSYNPITKTNWEGAGIRPDVLTSNEEDALNMALVETKR